MRVVLAAIAGYFRELRRSAASGWSYFWFEPADSTTLGSIRIATGMVLLYVHAVYTLDLGALVGPDAWVSLQRAAASPRAPLNFSYLAWLPDGWPLYVAHATGLVVLALFTLGLWTKLTSALALVVTLAYIHRADAMLFGLDQVTAMLGLYLAVGYIAMGRAAPAVSLDGLFARRRDWQRQLTHRSMSRPPMAEARATAANLAVRLIQVHMCLIYLFAGLAKRGDAWWNGSALWLVLGTYEFQTFDTRPLAHYPALLALGGYAIVLWELFFCVLVWIRLLRPLVLGLAVLLHGGIAVFMGLPTFAVIMLVGLCSFLDPTVLSRLYGRLFAAAGTMRLVYDGLCPLCIRAACWVKAFDPWDQVELVDFNRVDPASVHPTLDRQTCSEAMQLVTPEGTVRSGYYAFRALTRRLRLLWPVAAVLFIPGVSAVGNRVYRFVAARRRRLTCDEGACARHAAPSEPNLVQQQARR